MVEHWVREVVPCVLLCNPDSGVVDMRGGPITIRRVWPSVLPNIRASSQRSHRLYIVWCVLGSDQATGLVQTQ